MMISVCIPALRAHSLSATIASICRQTWGEWELLIVGQGSDTSVRQVVERFAAHDLRVKYIHINQCGISRARNAAIEAAQGDIIAMTDDDCEAQADWLATIASCFMQYPDIGLVGGSLIKPSLSRFVLGVCPALLPVEAIYDPIATLGKPPAGWDWIGANFAILRRSINAVGLFDEYIGGGSPDFPIADDTDYKLRLEAAGVKMLSTPRSIVYHTSGYRFGIAAIIRNSRNYARGNGGLAGKMTLNGDIRGAEWLNETRNRCFRNLRKNRRPDRFFTDAWGFKNFLDAYKLCLSKYRVHSNMLQPIT